MNYDYTARNRADKAQQDVDALRFSFEYAVLRIEALEKENAENKKRIARLEEALAPKTLDKPKLTNRA